MAEIGSRSVTTEKEFKNIVLELNQRTRRLFINNGVVLLLKFYVYNRTLIREIFRSLQI